MRTSYQLSADFESEHCCSPSCEAEHKARCRFWQLVKRGEASECWPWLGDTSHGRAGNVRWVNSKRVWAKHVAWRLVRGDIPEGLTVVRLCPRRDCVNPYHHELRKPHASGRAD